MSHTALLKIPNINENNWKLYVGYFYETLIELQKLKFIDINSFNFIEMCFSDNLGVENIYLKTFRHHYGIEYMSIYNKVSYNSNYEYQFDKSIFDFSFSKGKLYVSYDCCIKQFNKMIEVYFAKPNFIY